MVSIVKYYFKHKRNAKKIQIHDKTKRQNNNYDYNADKQNINSK